MPSNELFALAESAESKEKYRLSEVLFPVIPSYIKVTELTDEHKKLLHLCTQLKINIYAYVREKVINNYGKETWEAVFNSVSDSVGNFARVSNLNNIYSSGISILAYIGLLFNNHPESYEFQPFVDLWYQGILVDYKYITVRERDLFKNKLRWTLFDARTSKELYSEIVDVK